VRYNDEKYDLQRIRGAEYGASASSAILTEGAREESFFLFFTTVKVS
jgi:hypothetical protein